MAPLAKEPSGDALLSRLSTNVSANQRTNEDLPLCSRLKPSRFSAISLFEKRDHFAVSTLRARSPTSAVMPSVQIVARRSRESLASTRWSDAPDSASTLRFQVAICSGVTLRSGSYGFL